MHLTRSTWRKTTQFCLLLTAAAFTFSATAVHGPVTSAPATWPPSGGGVLYTQPSVGTPMYPTPQYVTQTLSLPGTGWNQVIYDPLHPNVAEIIRAIVDSAYILSIVDPNLLNMPITYYILNGKKYEPTYAYLMASEFIEPDMIHYYNPKSPVIIASKARTGAVSHAMASNPGGGTDFKRLQMHELGHVKWNTMDPVDKQLWTSVYNLSKELNLDRPTQQYQKENGELGNYYDDMGAEEGFCEAYADHNLTTDPEVPLDSSITNFMNNLPKV